MYYVLYRKTENLTPDEQNAARRGGIWLHTGISSESRFEATEKMKLRKKHTGQSHRMKVMSEGECQRSR